MIKLNKEEFCFGFFFNISSSTEINNIEYYHHHYCHYYDNLNNHRIHVIECPFNLFTPQLSYGRIICRLLYFLSLWTNFYSVTIQMKTRWQTFCMVLCISLDFTKRNLNVLVIVGSISSERLNNNHSIFS